MAEWVTYGLQVEMVAMGIFLYGLAMILRAVRHISEEFQFAIILVLLSLVMEVIQGTMTTFLLVKGIPVSNPVWAISPFVGLVGAYFLVAGSKKFLTEIERD